MGFEPPASLINHHPPAGFSPAPLAPAAFNRPAPLAPTTAAPQAGGQAWVNQFAAMQLAPDAKAHNNMAMPNQAMPSTMAPAMGMQQNPMAYNSFGGMGMGMGGMGMGMGMQGGFGMGLQQQQPHFGMTANAPAATATESSLDIEAFNRAFGEFDENDFERELAQWNEEQNAAGKEQNAADQELQDAQDEWMAMHGPRAEAQAATATQPPTAEEMAVIDKDLNELAEDLERRRIEGDPAVLPTKGKEAETETRQRRHDDELAKAAVDILSSVANNTSEKFKNSSFFDLMRRIGNREIVVEGTNLVDAETGEKVEPNPSDHDTEVAAKGKGREGGRIVLAD